MALTFRLTYGTPTGKKVTDGVWEKLNSVDHQCSCPEKSCHVGLEELPDARFHVTVVRPKPVVSRGDWSTDEPNIGHYHRTFDDPCVEEITAAISELLQQHVDDELATGLIEEFLFNLSMTRKEFNWKLVPDRGWHSENRSAARFELLAFPRAVRPPEAGGVDPIRAICYALTGAFFGDGQWEEAAKTVGLPLSSALDLMSAARDQTWQFEDGQIKRDERLTSLRVQLLNAVQLNDIRRTE
jgi:hypothetical protein